MSLSDGYTYFNFLTTGFPHPTYLSIHLFIDEILLHTNAEQMASTKECSHLRRLC